MMLPLQAILFSENLKYPKSEHIMPDAGYRLPQAACLIRI
jgi:hypothetical protein